jgi:anti-sigma factor RsiW
MVHMCPDYQIISVYLDQELPSPWKEKMELHLLSCPVCNARLERFRKYSEALEKSHEEGLTPKISSMEAAKDRVWQRMVPLETEKWGWRPRGHNFWYRTLSIPLPAAAAVAALFIMVFALALLRQPTGIPPSQDTIAASEMVDMQDIIPASDMNSVLQYLGNQDMTDLVIIRLPETSSFFSSGEPTMLRAADYSKRNRSP